MVVGRWVVGDKVLECMREAHILDIWDGHRPFRQSQISSSPLVQIQSFPKRLLAGDRGIQEDEIGMGQVNCVVRYVKAA